MDVHVHTSPEQATPSMNNKPKACGVTIPVESSSASSPSVSSSCSSCESLSSFGEMEYSEITEPLRRRALSSAAQRAAGDNWRSYDELFNNFDARFSLAVGMSELESLGDRLRILEDPFLKGILISWLNDIPDGIPVSSHTIHLLIMEMQRYVQNGRTIPLSVREVIDVVHEELVESFLDRFEDLDEMDNDEWEADIPVGALVSYDQGEEKNTQCLICFETKVLHLRFCCNFPTCDDCVAHYVTTQVQQAIVKIECLNPDCPSFVHRDEILARLPSDLKDKFYRFLVDANKEAHIKTCPHCSDITTVDKSLVGRHSLRKNGLKVTCAGCHLVWCFQCQAPWHKGVNCKTYQRGDKMLRSWAQEYHYGQQNAQKCPSCQIYIQRTTGCDHMTCTRCMRDFCYRCGERYRGLKFLGNHYSRFSVFGCKYRFLPNRPVERKLIRGALLGGEILSVPLLAGLAVVAGGVILGIGAVALPFYGAYKLHKNMKRNKRIRQRSKAQRRLQQLREREWHSRDDVSITAPMSNSSNLENLDDLLYIDLPRRSSPTLEVLIETVHAEIRASLRHTEMDVPTDTTVPQRSDMAVKNGQGKPSSDITEVSGSESEKEAIHACLGTSDQAAICTADATPRPIMLHVENNYAPSTCSGSEGFVDGAINLSDIANLNRNNTHPSGNHLRPSLLGLVREKSDAVCRSEGTTQNDHPGGITSSTGGRLARQVEQKKLYLDFANTKLAAPEGAEGSRSSRTYFRLMPNGLPLSEAIRSLDNTRPKHSTCIASNVDEKGDNKAVTNLLPVKSHCRSGGCKLAQRRRYKRPALSTVVSVGCQVDISHEDKQTSTENFSLTNVTVQPMSQCQETTVLESVITASGDGIQMYDGEISPALIPDTLSPSLPKDTGGSPYSFGTDAGTQCDLPGSGRVVPKKKIAPLTTDHSSSSSAVDLSQVMYSIIESPARKLSSHVISVDVLAELNGSHDPDWRHQQYLDLKVVDRFASIIHQEENNQILNKNQSDQILKSENSFVDAELKIVEIPQDSGVKGRLMGLSTSSVSAVNAAGDAYCQYDVCDMEKIQGGTINHVSSDCGVMVGSEVDDGICIDRMDVMSPDILEETAL